MVRLLPVKNREVYMSKFITELKLEHCQLLKMLESFKKGQGIVGREWKESLFAARELFLAHLKKEDEQLYPLMLDASVTNPDLERTLHVFTEDMKRVSAMTIRFLDKYNTVSGGTNFIQDFAEVEINLRNRIEQEESTLYPEYEKLVP